MDGARPITDHPFKGHTAFILGNEVGNNYINPLKHAYYYYEVGPRFEPHRSSRVRRVRTGPKHPPPGGTRLPPLASTQLPHGSQPPCL
eukprot:3883726-Pyramimonas_sp.AAC.1